ncbi:MAG: tRNA threonylcarbamoyladenosine dehydratase, partial [Clostridia bacterium]|nr:tRNA threonylcarbamoyladenosine dehydratase [Clostridia bacterium]
EVTAVNTFYLPDNADSIDLSGYDYIVDAVDNVSAKIELAVRASALGVPIISCMGMGNKLHPEMLEVSDIYSTSVCPLARVMRRELKSRGIKKLNVVYSREEPIQCRADIDNIGDKRLPGSISFVPSAAGLLIASVICREIVNA